MVYIHLADGVEEIEALTPCDLLRRVDVDVKTVSVTGEKMVQGAHGIRVEADLLFEEADYKDCTMIVLPGGLPGAFNLQDHTGLEAEIRKFAEEGRPLAAICAAPSILVHKGLLDGKKAVCFPGFEGQLGNADVQSDAIVTDGNIITGCGAGAAMKFGFEIVKYIQSEASANHFKAAMLCDR